MTEDYFYLDLDGEKVFAGLYRPAAPPTAAVVLCHPLGEEKLWAHRVFASLARILATSGLAVLRFDFRGEGDSDRDFERSDFQTRVADVHLAIRSVRELNPDVRVVSLVGLRLGAAFAATAAGQRDDVAQLVLWDPVVDGAAYMQAVLRLNLMYQMALHRRVIVNRDALVARLTDGQTVNIEGYELARPLFEQVSNFRLQDALHGFPGETCLVQIGDRDAAPKAELARIADSLPRCRLEIAHEEPFWREIKPYYQRAVDLNRVTLQALGVTK
jgi:exosortase A-associated hydrolase 2